MQTMLIPAKLLVFQMQFWEEADLKVSPVHSRDYQAPPLEALRQMLQSRDVQPEAAQPPARFDGQSSMHADYQAPPMTAFAPGRLQQKRPEPSSRDIFYPYPTSVKESTAHQDYQAPAMEDVRGHSSKPES